MASSPFTFSGKIKEGFQNVVLLLANPISELDVAFKYQMLRLGENLSHESESSIYLVPCFRQNRANCVCVNWVQLMLRPKIYQDLKNYKFLEWSLINISHLKTVANYLR